MRNRIRYTDTVQCNDFYRLPTFLFSDQFKTLSANAKVLYMLLMDRLIELSEKNGWPNDKNEDYIIMPREEMCKLVGVSMKTVIKVVNELIKFGLLEEKPGKQGKPNQIYLLAPE